jgi:hypothetical protein
MLPLIANPRPPWTAVWSTIFFAHTVVAGVWLAMMPGGFPCWHVRFWMNSVLPWAVIVLSVTGVVAVWRKRSVAYLATVTFFPIAWTAGLVVAAVIFPISSRRLAVPGLAATAVLWGAWWVTCRHHWAWRWPMAAAVGMAMAAGSLVPMAQRAPEPSTRPAGVPFPNHDLATTPTGVPPRLEITPGTAVRTSDGEVTVRCRQLTVALQALLEFESVSPDRCWTIFAPRERRGVWVPRLRGYRADADAVELQYGGPFSQWLEVRSGKASSGLDVTCLARLERPVYSHLNTWTELFITGHRRLTLSFSPCPKVRIEARPADYPTGRPARHAYLGTDGMFHVVEARSGEKGPFRPLASGRLVRRDALIVTLYDEDEPVCRLHLDDWAGQASTALSPTAGWGVPVNAIEFQRLDDDLDSPVSIWITLAGTSVGRGWDSVGYAPGTYRNRIRVEPGAVAPTPCGCPSGKKQ